jgi:ABC-2 type transport system ATP-binding protein
VIRVDRLTKRFGHVTAVDDLSFEVARGEVVGFLGPNGAGKTTTMRVLTGFIPATDGRVSVAGHDVLDDPLSAKRAIGYLPESVPIYADMAVAAYLRFVCDLKGIPRGRQVAEVERVMAMTDIVDRRNRLAGHLSKGLKKRVGIAQALLGNPDVLILDEPTEGLDPNQVVSIRELVTALGGEHTVILSTHILSEVEQTCDRVLIIDSGRLIADDSVEEMRAGRGGARVRLVIEGDADRARAALLAVPGVRDLRESVDAAGLLSVDLTVDRAGATPELAAQVVNAGLGLVELHRRRLSLEEVFVSLTRGEGGS